MSASTVTVARCWQPLPRKMDNLEHSYAEPDVGSVTHTQPKQSRKTKPRTPNAPASSETVSLEYLGITDPATAARLEACEENWQTSERMDTEVVFIRGAVVAEARTLCDSQKTLDKWSKARLKVTRRGAENYERVHHNFADRSERFIAAGVGPTVMYSLLAAEPDKVEAVLRHYEAGGSMTAREAGNFIDQPDADIPSGEEAAELAGPDGIRLLTWEKVKTTLPDIVQRLQAIMTACLHSLDDHHRGVRVKKGELADKIELDARLAVAKLENLAFTVGTGAYGDPWRFYPERPSVDAGWGKLARLLSRLGGRANWGDPLGPWLIDEVIPSLEWGLGSKLLPLVLFRSHRFVLPRALASCYRSMKPGAHQRVRDRFLQRDKQHETQRQSR